jgi:hypothetical protein|nr:MAG TPA: hypothetical protein [Caudoviricetes sp.]DAY45339.1 MAG TPA: hypothetical protein [Caudoviricetes sp.]
MTKETEDTHKAVFDWRISMGNLLVVVGMICSGFWFLANVDKANALQDAKIENYQTAMQTAIEAERQARKDAGAVEQQARREADQDLRIRMDADRAEQRQQYAEMRQQFAKLNDKIDALLKERGR